MKSKLLLLLLMIFCARAFASETELPLSTDVYKVVKIDDSTYLINDNNSASCYLLTGDKKALLIDTGIGDGNIGKLVASLTNLPVTTVVTHGHSDHIGACYQLKNVLMCAADTTLYNGYYNPQIRPAMIRAFLGSDQAKALGLGNLPENAINQLATLPPAKLTFVKDGDVIDLGGRKLEIIALPGHTTGSVMLKESQRGYLFSGDAIIGWLLLCFPESFSPQTYYDNLCKLMPKLQDISTIYTGHDYTGQGLPASYADSIRTHLDQYLKGNAKGEAAEMCGVPATLYRFTDWRMYVRP